MKNITSREFYNRVTAKEVTADLSVVKEGFGFALTDQTNILTFVFSSKATDLSGDRVFPDGIDISNYMARNPLILLHHDMHTFPIGKTIALGVVGDQLVGTIEFFCDLDEADVGTRARAAVELIKRGTMGLSITFIPKEFELNTTDGCDFIKSEIIETSVCTVPCNRESYLIPTPDPSDTVSASITDGFTAKIALVQRIRLASRRTRAIALAS